MTLSPAPATLLREGSFLPVISDASGTDGRQLPISYDHFCARFARFIPT
jgi:hypothetical protein